MCIRDSWRPVSIFGFRHDRHVNSHGAEDLRQPQEHRTTLISLGWKPPLHDLHVFGWKPTEPVQNLHLRQKKNNVLLLLLLPPWSRHRFPMHMHCNHLIKLWVPPNSALPVGDPCSCCCCSYGTTTCSEDSGGCTGQATSLP